MRGRFRVPTGGLPINLTAITALRRVLSMRRASTASQPVEGIRERTRYDSSVQFAHSAVSLCDKTVLGETLKMTRIKES